MIPNACSRVNFSLRINTPIITEISGFIEEIGVALAAPIISIAKKKHTPPIPHEIMPPNPNPERTFLSIIEMNEGSSIPAC